MKPVKNEVKEKLPSGSLVLPKAQYSSPTTGQAVGMLPWKTFVVTNGRFIIHKMMFFFKLLHKVRTFSPMNLVLVKVSTCYMGAFLPATVAWSGSGPVKHPEPMQAHGM